MTSLAEDLTYRYGSTYISWPAEGEFRPFLVTQVSGPRLNDPARLVVQGAAINKKGQCEEKTIPLHEVDLHLPMMNTFNYDKGVIIPWLIPNRRSRRGLRPEYMQVRKIGVTMRGRRLDPAEMFALYNPEYTPYFEAIQGVYDGKYRARSISRNLWVGRPMFKDEKILALGYRNEVVGDVDENGNILLLPEYANLKEEIEEFEPVYIMDYNRHQAKMAEAKEKVWPQPLPDATKVWTEAYTEVKALSTKELQWNVEGCESKPARFGARSVSRSELVMARILGEVIGDLPEQEDIHPIGWSLLGKAVASDFYTRYSPTLYLTPFGNFIDDKSFRILDRLLDCGIKWERDAFDHKGKENPFNLPLFDLELEPMNPEPVRFEAPERLDIDIADEDEDFEEVEF